MSERDEFSKEYYKLIDIVNDFDMRLITVKGWSVTLSLASLVWGFQYSKPGMFLVAALSGFAFWFIEGVVKRHQMRYYVRMREIEYICFEQFKFELPDGSQVSTPQIDWSWQNAHDYLIGLKPGSPPVPKRYNEMPSYTYAMVLPHVALPHIIAIIAGISLLLFSYTSGGEFP
jgi:hypothetical protein